MFLEGLDLLFGLGSKGFAFLFGVLGEVGKGFAVGIKLGLVLGFVELVPEVFFWVCPLRGGFEAFLLFLVCGF